MGEAFPVEARKVALADDAPTLLAARKAINIFPRAVRAAGGFAASIEIPPGITSITIFLRIYAVTGTFAAGEGLTLRIMNREKNLESWPGQLVSPTITATGYGGLQMGAKGAKDDATAYTRFWLQTAASPGTLPLCSLNITGTFAAGQGFDCEVWALLEA